MKNWIDSFIRNKAYIHGIVVLGFALVSLLFYYPVLSGKTLLQSDIRQYEGMSRPELFEPAIKLARDGFGMNERMYNSLNQRPEFVAGTQAGRDLYYDSDGKVLPAGSWITNEALAQAFERIAKQGFQAFYGAELGEEIVATVASATPREGAMTTEDLAGYEPKVRDAVCGSYRRYRVCSMGPPSSGGVAVIQMLGQLERFDLAALGVENPVTWHLFYKIIRNRTFVEAGLAKLGNAL